MCLSRQKNLEKQITNRDEKLTAMNKLVASLFASVTDLVGSDEEKEK